MKEPFILFIHPQGYNWLSKDIDITRIANIMPPYGLLMLSSYLEKRNIKNEILDLYAYPEKKEDILKKIKELSPTHIGITCTTSSFFDGLEIAKMVKENFKEIEVIFGGVHPTSIYERILKNFKEIDYIVVGEGEETIHQLLTFEDKEKVKGIALRKDGKVLFTGRRNLIEDLDALPFPAYHKLKNFPEKYLLPIFNYPRSPSTTFLTSRGCPFNCSYCDRSVFGPTFRAHSSDYLIEHLKFLKSSYRIRHINIYDDNFLLDKNRVLEFCEKILKEDLKITFNCIGRANHLDDEVLKNLKKAGCWMINIGVESGDEELLKPHRAKPEIEKIKEIVRKIKENGIRVKGLFMMGIPGETRETIEKTIRFALENPFDDLNVTKFTPFPGTPVYEKIKEYGEFKEDWALM
ncbi:MAG: radical SAM protein, partial [Thermoanaerobaculia bacterium]